MAQAIALGLRFASGAFAALLSMHLATALPASAQELIGEADARAAIERDYGVEVLGVSEVTVDGVPAFRVTVMNPGGDFNEAFMVTTLIVDRRSGKLVPQVREGTQGAVLPPPAQRETGENSGPQLRRETLR